MKKGHCLEFSCINCSTPIQFSVFGINNGLKLTCSACEKEYLFDDPDLLRQMTKFEALCLQIHDSDEILGNTNVGVDVEGYQVKIPYKILLTRLTTSLSLQMGSKDIEILFRLEPIEEIPKLVTLKDQYE